MRWLYRTGAHVRVAQDRRDQPFRVGIDADPVGVVGSDGPVPARDGELLDDVGHDGPTEPDAHLANEADRAGSQDLGRNQVTERLAERGGLSCVRRDEVPAELQVSFRWGRRAVLRGVQELPNHVHLHRHIDYPKAAVGDGLEDR